MYKNDEYPQLLLKELTAYQKETEWLEFKHNNASPDEIGEQISALSNAAALCGKAFAYLVWGVQDKTHDVIGTSFSYSAARIGNEELESWLLRQLDPKPNFHFFETTVADMKVVMLEIPRAFIHPVRFKGEAFIRVGSYTKKLKDFAEKEKALWKSFNTTSFEMEIAAEKLSIDAALSLIDYSSYFEMLGQHVPTNTSNIIDALIKDSMIRKTDANMVDILNLGAILFAKNLNQFNSLKRKTLRIIIYKGNDRTETIREEGRPGGYAVEFGNLISIINDSIPTHEVMGDALRKNLQIYPKLAVRELVANALMHQDFSISGAGPMVEIFKDRIEVSNPGIPLIETDRFIDSPPRSRNEYLASFMRRIGICEERGSGVDKIIKETEAAHLPAPLFETVGDNTKIILFGPRTFNEMEKKDRLRACYQHACLKYVARDFMTNSSIRERLNIPKQNSAIASRLIKEAIEAGLIALYTQETSKKYSKYVPFWAL